MNSDHISVELVNVLLCPFSWAIHDFIIVFLDSFCKPDTHIENIDCNLIPVGHWSIKVEWESFFTTYHYLLSTGSTVCRCITYWDFLDLSCPFCDFCDIEFSRNKVFKFRSY